VKPFYDDGTLYGHSEPRLFHHSEKLMPSALVLIANGTEEMELSVDEN